MSTFIEKKRAHALRNTAFDSKGYPKNIMDDDPDFVGSTSADSMKTLFKNFPEGFSINMSDGTYYFRHNLCNLYLQTSAFEHPSLVVDLLQRHTKICIEADKTNS